MKEKIIKTTTRMVGVDLKILEWRYIKRLRDTEKNSLAGDQHSTLLRGRTTKMNRNRKETIFSTIFGDTKMKPSQMHLKIKEKNLVLQQYLQMLS